LTEIEWSVAGTTTLDREWFMIICQNLKDVCIVLFLETVKKNVLNIVLIIVNINKDENKSLISNQFSLKNDFPPLLGELFCGGKN
jgi:hypothetical protein